MMIVFIESNCLNNARATPELELEVNRQLLCLLPFLRLCSQAEIRVSHERGKSYPLDRAILLLHKS
jgi:hypothetical protein